MFTPEVLGSLITNVKRSDSPRGVSCYFIRINDEWGIKVYKKEAERDNAYARQNHMEKHGYAPKTGVTFEIGQQFCYITEIAEPLLKHVVGENSVEHYARFKIMNDNQMVMQPIYELVKKMELAGYYMWDAHVGNFGMLKGELVCIDFGD